MFNKLSKNKINRMIIETIKNFFEAEIFNLSSINPKKNIKKDITKNKTKFS